MEQNSPQKKIRIAFFGNDFSRQGKGTAHVIQKIAETLARQSDVELVLLRPEGPVRHPLVNDVKNVIIPRRYSSFFSYVWFFLVHRDSYDAVVMNRVVYPGFWFLHSRRFILFVYDASLSEVSMLPLTGANAFFAWFLRFVGQYFLDAVIAVSHDARKGIITRFHIAPDKVHVISPAAGSEYTMHTNAVRIMNAKLLSERYRIRSPYLLDVSRLDPHKNVLRVVEAFFLLKEKYALPHTLVLAGGVHDTAYTALVKSAIERSPFGEDVLFVSYVTPEDMPKLYNCSEMLVFPSLVEGFGMPLIEAMACGVPTLTSTISCLPEVAGGAAVLVDPLNVDAIAAGITSILENQKLKDDLITKGLSHAKDFSWSQSAAKLLSMIS